MNNDLTPYLAETKKGEKIRRRDRLPFFLVNKESMPQGIALPNPS